MMKDKKCLPLKMLKNYSRKYPKCWNYIDQFHERQGEKGYEWDPLCYVPMGITVNIPTFDEDIDNFSTDQQFEYARDAAYLSALAAWRQNKQIYVFDSGMEQLLYEQSDDVVVPSDALRSIPYSCIYIKTNNLDFDGFFTYFDQDLQTGKLLFYLLPLNDTNSVDSIQPIYMEQGNTVLHGFLESYKETVETITENTSIEREAYLEEILQIKFGKYLDITTKMLQLVLYICSHNPDITENRNQKKIYRKPESKEQIKDNYSEIQIMDVGNHVSKKIPAFVKNNSQNVYSARTGQRMDLHILNRYFQFTGHWYYPLSPLAMGKPCETIKWIPSNLFYRDEDPDIHAEYISMDSKSEDDETANITEQCIPMIYAKAMAKLFPNVLQRVEKSIQTNAEWHKLMEGDSLNSKLLYQAMEQEFIQNSESWPLIHQNRRAWYSLLDPNDKNYYPDLRKTDEKTFLAALTMLRPVVAWWPYKQIYSFPKEIRDILIAQKDASMNIPVQVLQNFPYPCAYFDVPFNEFLGFFVHFDCRDEGKQYLGIEFISKVNKDHFKFDGYLELEINENITIEDETKRQIGLIHDEMPSHFLKMYEDGWDPVSSDMAQDSIEQTAIAMQFILYVCSNNAEISPDKRTEVNPKINEVGNRKDTATANEVRNNICGQQFSIKIRQMKRSNKGVSVINPNAHGTPKSPHVRRGHWHHYWTGPKAGLRKLILNWIAPIFVHSEDETLPTENIVDFR